MDFEKDLNDINTAGNEGRLNQIEQYQLSGYGGLMSGMGSHLKQALAARRAQILAEAQAAQKAQQEKENAIQGRKGDLVNSYADQARKQLSQSVVENTKNAASRGLLHSGLKQGADQESHHKAASNVAGYQAEVNRAGDQELGGMEADMASEGLNRYQSNANQAAQVYQNELGKQNQKQSTFGSLGSAIGGMAGSAAAGGGLFGKAGK